MELQRKEESFLKNWHSSSSRSKKYGRKILGYPENFKFPRKDNAKLIMPNQENVKRPRKDAQSVLEIETEKLFTLV
nr:unnamed protein product [Callosobruchus analis]